MPDTDPPIKVDDAELARRMAAGDQAALVTMLAVYGPGVKGYLHNQFGQVLDDGECDEVLNQAALNLWLAASRYDHTEGGLRGWFTRIARNAAISLIRGETKHQAEPLNVDPAEDLDDICPVVEASDYDRLKKVEDFINNKLEGIEKIVALNCFTIGGDPDIGRLAAKLGKPRSNIDTVKSKVKKKIREAVLALEASEADAKVEL